jgi:ribosomal protein L20A (L18A)
VGIRAPVKGTPAYTGMEIQLLDDNAKEYKDLEPVQFTGAVYGAIACKRGHSKPAGKWNTMEIMANGSRIRVTLNGAVITEGDLSKVGPKEIHGGKLKGLANAKGHIGFCGHAHRVEFRNVRIKELKTEEKK